MGLFTASVRTGRPLSPEHRKAMSDTRKRKSIGKGVPLSAGHRAAIATSAKGKKRGSYGPQLSPYPQKGVPWSVERRARHEVKKNANEI
jgi:hypothetical protein